MKLFLCLVLIISYFMALPAHASKKIAEVEFVDATLLEVIRGLSELTDSNIIATKNASKSSVTIHLKNVTVEEAIKSIARINDLWYRYDSDTNTFRLMTREEYGKDLVITESERIEVYTLLNANVQVVAQAIQDLFGNRVVLSYGIEAGLSGSSNTNNRGSQSNRNNRSGNQSGGRQNASNPSLGGGLANAGATIDSADLTQSQLEQLAQLKESDSLNSQTLQQVTVKAQPVYVTLNNEHNMILVRTDDEKVLDAISKLVNKMDIPVAQVMLEMKVLNVLLGEDFNSIFNFSVQPSGGNNSTSPILLGNSILPDTGSFVYEFLNSRLQANIEFLQENRRIKILSNPMVLASNHRLSELFIGEENLLVRGFEFTPPVVSTTGSILSPGILTTRTELRDIGITLKITPRINTDKTVALDIEQENSTLNRNGQTIPVDTGNIVQQLPIDTVDTARLNGTVMAKDGLTVAVGGLIRTSKNRDEKVVPLLGDIPVIGRVFRSTVELEEETETVLLITPHIITKPEETEKVRTADNAFYKTHNANYADPVLPGNKFLDGPGATKSKSYLEPNAKTADEVRVNRSDVYLEMSEYASEMVKIPTYQRVKDPLYEPVSVKTKRLNNLFQSSSLTTDVVGSWNRGGLYVTAVKVANSANNTQTIDYSKVKGKWLAASAQNEVIPPNNFTYLYLISALTVDETIAE